MDWGVALPGGIPTAQVRKPIKPRGRDRRVSDAEIAKILDVTESAKLQAIITLAIETGMRRSELADLTWEEIDLKTQTVHLPRTKTDIPRTVPYQKQRLQL